MILNCIQLKANHKMPKTDNELLIDILVKLGVIEEKLRHVPSTVEFSTFKTKVITWGCAIMFFATIAMWHLGRQ